MLVCTLETHKMCVFRHFSIITYLAFITAIIIPLSHGLWNGLNNFAPACKFSCLEFYTFSWSTMQCSRRCQSKLFGGRQFAWRRRYLWHTKYATHQKLFAWQYEQYHLQGIFHWQWLADLWGAGWLCPSVWRAEWSVPRKIRPRFRYVIWCRCHLLDLIYEFE